MKFTNYETTCIGQVHGYFGITSEIDLIVEDNTLKHGKYIPGVKIPIVSKSEVSEKDNVTLVLAWNFYEDIKKNNTELSNNFINIKDLEN